MRLEKASYKAIKYACLNFHYAKAIPVNCIGYSVFNNAKEWCGVVIYSLGANKNLPTLYNLKQGHLCELTRMALNGKQESTSKVLSISIKLIKKDLPLSRLIVSYSDRNQGHFGVIYQATNWYYTGDSQTTQTPILNGKRVHAKSIYSKFGTNNLTDLKAKGINIAYVKDKPKHRYIYPLDKSLIPLCKSLSKPYPKHAAVAHLGEHLATSQEGAFDATLPLNLTAVKQP